LIEKGEREKGVDADLNQRTAMVFGDGFDDLVVALGLRAAGRIAGEGLSAEELVGLGTPYALAESVGSELGKVTLDSIRLFYDLWYRLKVPFGRASLQWWYLLSLALRDADLSPTEALASTSAWIDCLEAADSEMRPSLFADLTGLRGAAEPEFTAADLSDVHALARAVAAEAPLLSSRPAEGRGSLVPGQDSLHALCHGRRPGLKGMVENTRQTWCALMPEDRTALLIELEQRVLSLEQIRLSTGTEILNNKAVATELRRCAEEHPSQWSLQSLVLATLAWCWKDAGFILQELNQSLIFLPTLMVFMEKRIGDYDAILGVSSPAPRTAHEAADLLALRRAEVERSHLRCISFDGSNWERREFLIERTSLASHEALPDGLQTALEQRFGVPFQGEGASLEAWDRYLEVVLEGGATPTDLIRCVAGWAANAPDLPVDYAIFTAPQGVKLDRPWELELTEVFCYTAFRSDLEPSQSGVPFDSVGIQNAIGQRMRYNVVKKAQNYALVRRFPAQSFNLPDIAVGEDANHGGHRAGGIRLSCRLPNTVHWRGHTWKGLADVRLNRLDYTSADPFKPSEVPVGFRYVKWEKGIADATYRRGLLFDSVYCSKLEKHSSTGKDAMRDPDRNGGARRDGD
jgi:hypothetical protein